MEKNVIENKDTTEIKAKKKVKNYKMRFQVSDRIILAVLVINWVSAILEGLSPVVGLLASMFLSLIISLYTDTTVCAFYEQCVDDTAKAPVYTFDGPGGPGSGEDKTPLYPEDRQMNADEKEEKM